jgi:hypothetical protein
MSIPGTLIVVISVLTALAAIVISAKGAGRSWFLAAPLWLASLALIVPLIALPGVLAGTPLGKAGVLRPISDADAFKVLSIAALFTLLFSLGWGLATRRRFAWTSLDSALAPTSAHLLIILIILLALYYGGLALSGISPLDTLAVVTGHYGNGAPASLGFIYWLVPVVFIALPAGMAAVAAVARTKSSIWLAAVTNSVFLVLNALSGVRAIYMMLILSLVLIGMSGFTRHEGSKRNSLGIAITIGIVIVVLSAPLMTLISNARVGILAKATFETRYTALSVAPERQREPYGPVYSRIEGLALPFHVLPSSAALMRWTDENSLPFAVSLQDAIKTAVPRFIDGYSGRPMFLSAVDDAVGASQGAAVDSFTELYANVGIWLGSLLALAIGYGTGALQRWTSGRRSAAALLLGALIPVVVAQVFTRGYLFQTALFVTGALAGVGLVAMISPEAKLSVLGTNIWRSARGEEPPSPVK